MSTEINETSLHLKVVSYEWKDLWKEKIPLKHFYEADTIEDIKKIKNVVGVLSFIKP